MMSDVSLTVELEDYLYAELLAAANEAETSVSYLASRIIQDYLEENYGTV